MFIINGVIYMIFICCVYLEILNLQFNFYNGLFGVI